ncbi:MAG TPA: FtsX-like permease family protein, partial [Candidatus Dormibacteraeota bacterium]|nr:FtsX-like permease family protein [Candidatus Dormibacteraeota bacterium]
KNSAVQRVTPLRVFSEQVAGSVLGIATIDPSAYQGSSALQVTSGDHDTALRRLDDGPSMLVPVQLAAASGWHEGTELPVQTVQGTIYFEVIGQVAHSYPAGDGSECVLMSSAVARSYFGDSVGGFDDLMVTTSAAGVGAVDAAVTSYGMQAIPVSDIVDATRRSVEHSIGLLLALAIVAVSIAMLAVLNTLAVSVRAGNRELALLRAVGLSRRQALRRVMSESGLMAATAAVIGVAAGCVLAFPMLRASSSAGFEPGFVFPLETAGVLLAVIVLGTVAAAILPARRAVGRSVPSALRQE